MQRFVKHTTGKQVDAYMDAQPFIKKMVKDQVDGGTKAEGHVHIHKPEDFKKVCIAYLKKSENPDTGAAFTEAEAATWEPTINAFQDETEIHLHQDRGETGTAIHESMHLFENDTFANGVSWNTHEGATEYFARLIYAQQKITRGAFYEDQLKSVKRVVSASSKEQLGAAYFKGSLEELKTAVNLKKGAGTFGKWEAFMARSKYAEADALL